jgi:hypothetical protein
MDQQCWTGVHMTFVMITALPMFIVYVFGIPFAAGNFLRMNKHKMDPDHPEYVAFEHKFGFMFQSFQHDKQGVEQNLYMWGSLVYLRKVLLVSVAVYFTSDIHSQSLFGLLIVMVALALQTWYKPFKHLAMNIAETASLGCTFVTFFCGQFVYVDDPESLVVNTVSYLCLFVNVMFILGMLTLIGKVAREKDDKDAIKIVPLEQYVVKDDTAVDSDAADPAPEQVEEKSCSDTERSGTVSPVSRLAHSPTSSTRRKKKRRSTKAKRKSRKSKMILEDAVNSEQVPGRITVHSALE